MFHIGFVELLCIGAPVVLIGVVGLIFWLFGSSDKRE